MTRTRFAIGLLKRDSLLYREKGRGGGTGAYCGAHWHTSGEGIYEDQDPAQADMNLRGKFTTDSDGHIAFRSIKPIGYRIPINGR